jgi:hypothetical protein
VDDVLTVKICYTKNDGTAGTATLTSDPVYYNFEADGKFAEVCLWTIPSDAKLNTEIKVKYKVPNVKPTYIATGVMRVAAYINLTYLIYSGPLQGAMLFITPETDTRDFDLYIGVEYTPEYWGITVRATNEDGIARIESIGSGVTTPGTYRVWQAFIDLYTHVWSYFGYWEIEVGPSLSGDYTISFIA